MFTSSFASIFFSCQKQNKQISQSERVREREKMFFSSLLVFMKKKNVRIKCFVWVYMWCRLDWTVMLKPNCFYIVASLTTFRYDQVVLALVVLLVADKSESLFFAHQCSWAQFFLVRFLGFSSKIFNCGVETISSFFFVFVCGCWDVCATKCVCVFFISFREASCNYVKYWVIVCVGLYLLFWFMNLNFGREARMSAAARAFAGKM